MSAADWSAFRQTVVAPNTDPDRKPGQYAVSVRKQAAHLQPTASMFE